MEREIELTENDLVFVTNGSCTEGTIYGDHTHAPVGDAEVRTSGCWSLWKNIAAQHPSFGHPEKFCGDISSSNWESATITTDNEEIIQLDREDLQAGSPLRPGSHRRYRQLQGLQLAAELDDQPPGPVQGAGQEGCVHLGVCPVHR